jgi:DNA topoisomerase VI subunit A
VSCSKGFAIGDLLLYNAMDESEVDFRHASVPITEALTKFDFVQSDANFLLIVEKDAVFQRLLDEQWMDKFPNSILLTVWARYI